MDFDWKSFIDGTFNTYKAPDDNCCTDTKHKSKQYRYEIRFIIDGKDEHVCNQAASSKGLAELFFRDSMRAGAVPEDCRKWKYYEITSITRKD